MDRAARRLLTQKAQLGLLDADWTPEGSVAGADAVDLDSPANRALARRWPSGRSSCSRPGRRCRCSATGARRCAGWPSSGPAPRTRGSSWAATPFPTMCSPPPGSRAGARGADRGRPWRRSCQGSRSSTSRAARCRERTGPASRPRWPPPAGRPLRGRGRRPRRPVRPRVVRRRLRRRGPPAPGGAGGPAGRAPADGDAGGRGGGLRPPMPSATCMAAPPAWCRRSCRGRRRAGDRRRPLRPDPAEREAARADPEASRRAAQHVPPAAPRRPGERGISTLDATPSVPFGYGGSYTTFEVDALRISDAEVPTDGAFTVSVRVRNTGPREGSRWSSSTCTTSSPRSPAR